MKKFLSPRRLLIAIIAVNCFSIFMQSCDSAKCEEPLMLESQKQDSKIDLEYVLQKFVEAGFTIDRTAVVDEKESLTAEEALYVLENLMNKDSINARSSRAKEYVKIKSTKYGTKIRYEIKYDIFKCYLFKTDDKTRIVPYDMHVLFDTAGAGGMELGNPKIHESYDDPYVTYNILVQEKSEVIVLGVRAYRYQIHDLFIHFHARKMDNAVVDHRISVLELDK